MLSLEDGTLQVLADDPTKRREQIAGTGPNLRASRFRNPVRPLYETRHEDTTVIDFALDAAMWGDERSVARSAIVATVKKQGIVPRTSLWREEG